MATLAVSVKQSNYETPELLAKATRDTTRLLTFIHTRKPTPETLRQLSDMLADPSLALDLNAMCSINGRNSASLLSSTAHNEFRKLLLEAGANAAGNDWKICRKPLFDALRTSDTTFTQMLLEYGASPSARSYLEYPYQSIGHDLQAKKIPELMRLLVQYGFDPNIMTNDEDSSWRFAPLAEDKFRALADLGVSLMCYNMQEEIIESPITHGSRTLSACLKELRPPAFALRDRLTTLHAQPAACREMLNTLTPQQWMQLSNSDSLPLAFTPEIWHGHEQEAIHLVYTHLYPYQQQLIRNELIAIQAADFSGTPATWCDRIRTMTAADPQWSR